MGSIKCTTVYFDAPGEDNTEEVLKLAKKRADELGIRNIIVASTRGIVGVKASNIFKGYNLVVVPHHVGFREPGIWELTDENKQLIEKNGGKIHRGTHVFGTVERAIRVKFGTHCTLDIMAHTLRLFGQGMKAAIEIATMVADAGLIPNDENVIAIAGTGKGADTAVVIQPADSSRFFDMFVQEIIAKPRKRK